MPKFDYLKTHSHEAEVFDAFMRHSPEDRHAAVVATYDFSEAGLVWTSAAVTVRCSRRS